jgi:tRNA(Arg) A34 adenosine deaminase TadA
VPADDRERRWLDEAVAAAARNVRTGGGPFGALVVRDDDVVSVGVNQVTRSLDPTAHAEVVAIREACRALGDFRLAGCVLVSSCEPCPLCLSAAMWARVDRVVYAADRDDAAASGFDDRAFYDVFASPREEWPVRVLQLPHDRRTAPFDAWREHEERIHY